MFFSGFLRGLVVMILLYIMINSTFIACVFRRVRVVGERLQNRYCANFGGIAGIRIVPVLGASQSGIRAQVHGSLVVRSACKITLPTDVVVSSVKNYFLKLRWIVLISSDFSPYLYSFFSYLSDV